MSPGVVRRFRAVLRNLFTFLKYMPPTIIVIIQKQIISSKRMKPLAAISAMGTSAMGTSSLAVWKENKLVGKEQAQIKCCMRTV